MTINGDGNKTSRFMSSPRPREALEIRARQNSLKNQSVLRRAALRVALLLALAAVGGCTFLQDAATRLPGPRLYEKGAVLIDGIREFERRIGFRDTNNFLDVDHETESFPFCGIVSNQMLPYSYQDPAIRWIAIPSEDDCRRLAGPGADAFFDQTEAMGEAGTPVTPRSEERRVGKECRL